TSKFWPEWHLLKRFLFRELMLASVCNRVSRPSPTGDRHGRVHGVSRNTIADASGAYYSISSLHCQGIINHDLAPQVLALVNKFLMQRMCLINILPFYIVKAHQF